VRCSYNLGHHWLGYSTNGGAGARLAWEFLSAHPKLSSADLGIEQAADVNESAAQE
jgi:hypothetical protein